MNKKLATWQTSRVSRWGTRQSKEFLSRSRQQKQPFFSDSRTNVSKLGNFVVSHVCLPVIFRFYGAVKAVRGWTWKTFETVDCFPHFHVALKTLAHRNLDGISIYKRNYLYSLLERAKYTAGNFYIPRERSQRQRLLFKWNQLTSLKSLSLQCATLAKTSPTIGVVLNTYFIKFTFSVSLSFSLNFKIFYSTHWVPLRLFHQKIGLTFCSKK